MTGLADKNKRRLGMAYCERCAKIVAVCSSAVARKSVVKIPGGGGHSIFIYATILPKIVPTVEV